MGILQNWAEYDVMKKTHDGLGDFFLFKYCPYFRNSISTTFTHARPGSIYDRIYQDRMTDESFAKMISAQAVYEDFLDKEPNSAFFTTVSHIPDDIKCLVRENFYASSL